MVRSKRKSGRRIWLIVIAFVILAITVGVYYYQTGVAQAAKTSAAKTLKTAKVKRGDIEITATGTAILVPVAQAGLTFQSSGQIIEIRVQAGDTVKAGQVLAKLDTAELRLQLTQAEANLALAQSKWIRQTRRTTIYCIRM
jgi:multidrug efflux pump subunit AcrA (membrane-fusion protein)